MNEIAIRSYINNLSENGLRQVAQQLIQFPESRDFIERCIDEWEKFYCFHYPKRK
jgi:hypothetical protein